MGFTELQAETLSEKKVEIEKLILYSVSHTKHTKSVKFKM